MLLRLLIADLVGEDVTRESIATLRDDIADLGRRLEDSAATADEIAHRRKYLLLVNGFLRRLSICISSSSTRSSASSPRRTRPPVPDGQAR